MSKDYKVIEHFVRGKLGNPQKCEDILYFSSGDTLSGYAAVIDGSSIPSRSFGDKSSGLYIAEVIAEAVKSLAPGLDMPTATEQINAHIRDRLDYKDSSDVMQSGARPAASVAILSLDREEVWAYGDTLLMVDGKTYDLSKEIDKVTSGFRCTFVRQKLLAVPLSDEFNRLPKELLASGKNLADIKNILDAQTPAAFKELVEQLIRSTDDLNLIKEVLSLQQSRLLNNKAAGNLAYANLDGADEVIPLVRVISVKGAKQIIMASDGYPVLLSTLKDTEEMLAKVLTVDPLMVNPDLYPQVKGLRLPADAPMNTPWPDAFDDRCYLKLKR